MKLRARYTPLLCLPAILVLVGCGQLDTTDLQDKLTQYKASY